MVANEIEKKKSILIYKYRKRKEKIWKEKMENNGIYLSDTIKAFSILLLTDLCLGFHSTHGWELMIGSVYKDFGWFEENIQMKIGNGLKT